MNKKRPRKSNKSLVLVAVSVIIAGLLIWWLTSIISYQNTLHSQKKRLDEAAIDLKKVYDGIVLREGENVLEKSFRYICYESSVKYGRGQVSCGPEAWLMVKDSSLEDLKSKNIDILSRQDLFSEINGSSIDIFPGEKYESFRIYFIHRATGLNCFVIGGIQESNQQRSQEVQYKCSDRTIDILPGYVKAN